MSKYPGAEERLQPFDFAIMEHLPEEGTVLGYHPLFKTARRLLTELNDGLPADVPKIRIGHLNGRLRVLRQIGIVTPVLKLTGHIDGWQRTLHATDLLNGRGPRPGGEVS